MSLDNFIVRPKRRFVEKYAKSDAWRTLGLDEQTELVDEVLAGDHTIFLGRVHEMSHDLGKKPLLFFRGRFGGLADPQPAPLTLENVGHEFIW